MTPEQEQYFTKYIDGHSAILKELSDLKSSMAVNTNETANIKVSMNEMKQDVRDIKNETVSRREFNEALTSLGVSTLKKDVEDLKEFRWKLAGITSLAAATMTFVGQLLIKYLTR